MTGMPTRGRPVLITREVSHSECPWLPRPLAEGEILYEYVGYDYGVITPAGVALSETGDTPFFEVPRTAISWVYRG